MSLPENKTTVNLEVPFFSVIMLLHKGLIHIHSHIKLHFGESFTLTGMFYLPLSLSNNCLQVVFIW